jgi:hypothetical protein
VVQELNDVLRRREKQGQLRVLSFSEGVPTKIIALKMLIVPPESAYPGN